MLDGGSSQSDVFCRFCGSGTTRSEAVVNGYAYHRCDACEFTFTPQAESADAVARSREVARPWREELPEAGWANTEFLRPALALLPSRKLDILDFGTGQSVVPDLLRAGGHRVIAVDVAPPLRPHPDRLTGDVLDLSLSVRDFDLVFAFQVFEHLPEPRPILSRLIELTRPGGILAIHTDMETEERRQGFRNWWYVLPPYHCSFYRHRTFQRALDDTPHRIAHAEPKMVCIGVSAAEGKRSALNARP